MFRAMNLSIFSILCGALLVTACSAPSYHSQEHGPSKVAPQRGHAPTQVAQPRLQHHPAPATAGAPMPQPPPAPVADSIAPPPMERSTVVEEVTVVEEIPLQN